MKTQLLGLFGAVCLGLFVVVGCGGSRESSGEETVVATPALPTPTMPLDTRPDNPIVGQVAGELIRLDAILAKEAGLQWSAPPPGRDWREMVLQSREHMLDQLLLQKAILEAVKRDGLEDKVEKEVTASLGQVGPEKLQQSGMSMDQFRARIARILLQADQKPAPVTEREMKEYYEKYKTEKFLTSEKVEIRRIQRWPAPGQATAELQAEMERIRAEILTEFQTRTDPRQRTDFVSKLAHEYSQAPDARQGGWFVMYRPGQTDMSEEFRRIVFNSELHKLSPVHEVDGGFLLFYMDSHYGRVQHSYEENRDMIGRMMTKERQERFEQDWERGILEQAGAAKYLENLDTHLPPEPSSDLSGAPARVRPASPAPGGGG